MNVHFELPNQIPMCLQKWQIKESESNQLKAYLLLLSFLLVSSFSESPFKASLTQSGSLFSFAG